MQDDTIVAISTPPGPAGIGIVRMSGPEAISIGAGVFFSPKGISLFEMPSHTLRYGFIRDEDEKTIDEVLITVMRKPSTYTREDIVEINAHGGVVALRQILRLLLRKGARLSEPGEFTKRAFLNGRLDLAQAEAVADFIRAKSINQAKVSMRQLQGGVSGEIFKIKEILLEILAQIEASIDFPEEELEIDSEELLLDKLREIDSNLKNLLSQTKMSRLVREGARVAIIGRPNVGKSSLLNTLLSEERAIVTPYPGTTRDTIEEEIEIDGNLVRLIDTAGLCETDNPLEREGIKRTEACLKECDLVIVVLDGSEGMTSEDRKILFSLNGKKAILAINKIDLPSTLDEKKLADLFSRLPVVRVSAIQKINIEGLLKAIGERLWSGEISAHREELIVSLRHEEILENVDRNVREAVVSLEKGESVELISIELREAISHLGRITGEVYTEEILERIFSKFCVGK